jgi:hypothetical protein
MFNSISPSPPAPAPRRAWRRNLLIAGIGSLLGLWALPMALAHSPFVGWLERQLGSGSGCTVRLGSLSLGWFSAVGAYEVDIRDRADRPLLHAASVESDRTLLGLLLHRNDPGKFRVEKALVEVVFAGAGFNLEETLTHFIDRPAGNSAETTSGWTMPPLEVEVEDSRVKLTDTDTSYTWQMPVRGTVRLFQEEAMPVEARLYGTLGDEANPGSVEASVTVQAEGGAWKHGQVKARLQSVPAELALPVVGRWVPAAKLAGEVHGQCLLGWKIDRSAVTDVTVEGELVARGCGVRLPFLAERLVLDQVRVPGKLRFDGRRLYVESAELACDLGQARYSGTIDLSDPGLTWLDRPGQSVSASLNLVRLAEKLPRTLHIHPDLRLTSGELRLDAKSSGAKAAAGWAARLSVTNINGVRGNQPIAWQEPVVVDCRARQLGRGVPLIDELRCTSGFLLMTGTTTADGFRVLADADLGRLADPLSRFVDFGPTRLAGQAHVEVTVRPLPGDRFSASGSGRINDLFVEFLRGRPLVEELVSVELAAAGGVANGVQSVESARLTLGVGGDRIQGDLAEPLTDLAGTDRGIWQVQLEGDLARWHQRAQAFAVLPERGRLSGTVLAQGQVRRGRRGLECSSLAVSARDFGCTAPGLRIHEPTLYLHAAAWLDAAGALQLRDAQLRCASMSATAERFRWHPATARAAGTVKVRGDLARLREWVQLAHQAEAPPLAGQVEGQVDIRPDDDNVNLRYRLAVQDFALGQSPAPGWHDAGVTLVGKGRLEPARDRLLLGPMHVEGPLGAVDAIGTLDNLSDTWNIDLTGELRYDLEALEPLLASHLGGDLRLAGKDTRSFRLSGPLLAAPASGPNLSLRSAPPSDVPLQVRELHGDAAVAWQSLQTLGCDVGPAELRLCLQRGWLQLYPVHTTLNGGQLYLQPNLRLDPGPAELVLLPGPVVEKAKITPQMCAGALGYALPPLGHAAAADGTVSVTLEGGRIPLGDLARAEIKGKLVLHDARFSTGPLGRELSGLIKMPVTEAVVRPSEVPFHLVNGRIYHRNLEVNFGQFVVRSSGSVGLDGSLMLLVEMPVPAALTGSNKLGSTLANQTIRLPISGTIEQPRVDQKALQTITAHILRDVASEALKQELENRLKGALRSGGGR